jgi:hypothetical protein
MSFAVFRLLLSRLLLELGRSAGRLFLVVLVVSYGITSAGACVRSEQHMSRAIVNISASKQGIIRFVKDLST